MSLSALLPALIVCSFILGPITVSAFATPFIARSCLRLGVLAESSDVMLDDLYPPASIESRNSASRTDGYWKFVRNGEEPPLELTYGEFEIASFVDVVKKALSYRDSTTGEGLNFLDLGSGAGRLVVGAAINFEFSKCRGIEYLQSLHDLALDTTSGLDLPVEFDCCSWTDPYLYLGSADIVFVYSSCLGVPQRNELSDSLGRSLRPGTIVITTEYALPLTSSMTFRIVETLDVPNDLVGGTSTIYLHQINSSRWHPSLEGDLVASRPSPEQAQAIQAVKDLEAREGDFNPELFKARWQNACNFAGLPKFIYSNEQK